MNKDVCIKLIEKLEDGNKVQESSATMMLFMVQDLLDWAQIKSNNFRKNIQKFDILKAIHGVILVQQKIAIEKNLLLYVENVNIDENDPMIYSDKQRIQQVLLGLVSNALKFTKKGEIKIRIQTK